MNCPRCGEPMSGGVCNNCGFPAAKIGKKNCKNRRIVYITIKARLYHCDGDNL